MPLITYTIINHNNKSNILVQFETNAAWNKRMKAVAGVKWSKTLKGWTIPDTEINRQKCGFKLNDPVLKERVVQLLPQPAAEGKTSKEALYFMSDNNKAEMKRFLDQLALKAYSPSTIRTYRLEFAQLLQALGKFNVQLLQPQHLQRYLLHCINNGLKENSIHSRINALYPVGLKK